MIILAIKTSAAAVILLALVLVHDKLLPVQPQQTRLLNEKGQTQL